jgi:hypothetical protein
MVYSDPRQNFGSTSPLSPNTRPIREIVYPENNGEALPKLYLRSK